MRIDDRLLRCVVFIGQSDFENGSFHPAGTAFLVAQDDFIHLVTVNHIASSLGDAPFTIRLNKLNGGSEHILYDPEDTPLRWFSDENDPNLDLAVMPFHFDLKGAGYDCLFVPSAMLATKPLREEWNIGVGDLCYTVGLFRLMSGVTRNLPVVHSGSVALVPGDERIPVTNWLPHGPGDAVRYVEGYLVEMQNLRGLSGSPVFVRPSIVFTGLRTSSGETASAKLALADVRLLGVWQGSWDAPPGQVLAVEHGQPVRVPVGMGIVTPADSVARLLDLPALQEFRMRHRERHSTSNEAGPDKSGSV